MSQSRQKAAEALWHYFTLLARRVGLELDADNRQEIEGIVDDMIAAAVEAAAARGDLWDGDEERDQGAHGR